MIGPLDPGSPAAPPHRPPLLLWSSLEPMEPLRRLILCQRAQGMEGQRSHSHLSSPPYHYFPRLSSPPLLARPLPHLPFPLNFQSPAVFEPGLCSFDEPGHEHASVPRHLLQSSVEIQYCWRAASHSEAWQGSSDPGAGEWVGTLVVWM